MVHEVLEHRWYMTEKRNQHVPMAEALQSYIDDVLRHRRDEATLLLNPDTDLIKVLEAGVIKADDDEEGYED